MIITNHIQALLNLPNPSNDLTNLQQFYDSMETHVRVLLPLVNLTNHMEIFSSP